MNKVKRQKTVKLYRNKTKHLVCRVRVNNIPASFLIDTGASNSCVDKSKKERFLIEAHSETIEAKGAGIERLDAAMSKASHLHLGYYSIGFFNLILLDLQHVNATLGSQGAARIDGILGADLLIKSKAVIDYQQLKLHVSF